VIARVGTNPSPGAVYIVYGARTQPVNLTLPVPAGRGFEVKAAPGTSIKTAMRAGDFDRDGFRDLLVLSDHVYIVFGAASSGTVTLGADARSMAIVNGVATSPTDALPVGDFNGDGFDDVISIRTKPPKFGWYTQEGAAVLFGGPRVSSYDVRFPSARVATINGAVSCVWYSCGEGIALPLPIGDVNGDAFADLMNQTTSAYVILGRPGAPELRSGSPDAQTIRFANKPPWLAAVGTGDVTGDGIADLPFTDYSTVAGGESVFVRGRRMGPGTIDLAKETLVRYRPGTAEGIGGYRVPAGAAPAVSIGDIDGDGLPDLALPVPAYTSDGIERRGAIFLATHRTAPGPIPAPEADPTSSRAKPIDERHLVSSVTVSTG